ncbi:DmsC/YnfH family molybdoenzyme membrane anchor subunit [Pasteurellaceae bacterium LIM206]|nr:DmsC/YnfH family molybdoenzyme membrane anchor subunit [Pasteurellaceae bacterium LIM206]
MNGLHELPLVIFTVLAQSVVGAIIVLNVALVQGNMKGKNKPLFVLLVLLGIGFIASVMHLGSPWRAFNSLNRVGESMLSNEIAGGAAFFTVAGFTWLFSALGKLSANTTKILIFVTALLGLLFMYMMNNVYHIGTVPTWNNSVTSWNFYLTVVIAGFSLGYACFHTPAWIRQLVALGVFLAVLVMLYQGFSLTDIHSSIQTAVNLVPDFVVLNVVRLCLLIIGVWLLFRTNPNWTYLAATLIIFGEIIGRTLFYALHMTVGTAIAGLY